MGVALPLAAAYFTAAAAGFLWQAAIVALGLHLFGRDFARSRRIRDLNQCVVVVHTLIPLDIQLDRPLGVSDALVGEVGAGRAFAV